MWIMTVHSFTKQSSGFFITSPTSELAIPYNFTTTRQFIIDFYSCIFDISARNKLPPFIHYLINRTIPLAQANSKQEIYNLACLQFIYICLTQRHFHITCPCATFQGHSHNYYDHLYNLFSIAIKYFSANSDLAQESSIPREYAWFQLFISFNFADAPIMLFSMGITLLPFIYFFNLSLSGSHTEAEKTVRWNYLTKVQRYLTVPGNKLYVRYVNKIDDEEFLTEGSTLFYTGNIIDPFSMNNFDFRGCYFQKINFVQFTQQDIVQSIRRQRTMQYADCRFVTFKECNVSGLDVTGTEFSDAYLENLLGKNATWSEAISAGSASQVVDFPPITHNSFELTRLRVFPKKQCFIL